MRIGVVIVLLAAVSACSGRGLFRQYEYEEEMYLALDGSATVYVNSSLPALVALREAPFDPKPSAPVDRAAVSEYFSSPVTRVASVRTTRRNNRRFVHVRIDVEDVRRLNEAAPFAGSSYRFSKGDNVFLYHQTVGPPSGRIPESTGWDGDEVVAIRMHLPSVIVGTNNPAGVQRGNILEWEQSLTDRLSGVPVEIDVRMEGESILSRTLWLFAATIAAVALVFALLIWRIAKRGT